ncbi:hypothetical protein BJ742DRAFT_742528 [Cladochytrium replicatum]|nr:hypothetical protein BJ742DRAFT_742528 [Cladochytrium replicatum]
MPLTGESDGEGNDDDFYFPASPGPLNSTSAFSQNGVASSSASRPAIDADNDNDSENSESDVESPNMLASPANASNLPEEKLDSFFRRARPPNYRNPSSRRRRTQRTPQQERRGRRNRQAWVGMALMVLASFFFAAMNLAVTVLTTRGGADSMGTWEIIFWRSLVVYLLAVATMKYNRIKDPWMGPSNVRLGLALRGSFGVCTLGCGYFALQQLGLGDATAIGFLSPTFTGFLAFLILKEPWTRTDFMASLCALVGVTFIARPAFLFGSSDTPTDTEDRSLEISEAQRAIGTLVALIGAVFSSFSFITLRSLSKRIHPLHSVSALSYVGVLAYPLSLLVFPPPSSLSLSRFVPTDLVGLFWLCVVSLCGFTGQLMLSRAIQVTPAGTAALVSYTQVGFAFVMQTVVMGVEMQAWSIVGACVIGLGVVGGKAGPGLWRWVRGRSSTGEDGGSTRGTGAAAAAAGGFEGAEGAFYDQGAGMGGMYEGMYDGEEEAEVLPYADELEMLEGSSRTRAVFSRARDAVERSWERFRERMDFVAGLFGRRRRGYGAVPGDPDDDNEDEEDGILVLG